MIAQIFHTSTTSGILNADDLKYNSQIDELLRSIFVTNSLPQGFEHFAVSYWILVSYTPLFKNQMDRQRIVRSKAHRTIYLEVVFPTESYYEREKQNTVLDLFKEKTLERARAEEKKLNKLGIFLNNDE